MSSDQGLLTVSQAEDDNAESCVEAAQTAVLRKIEKNFSCFDGFIDVEDFDTVCRFGGQFALWMMVLEYSLALLVFSFGYYDFNRIARTITFIFLGGSMVIQVKIARVVSEMTCISWTRPSWTANVKNIMCLRLDRIKLRQWLYYLLALSPNSINILIPAIAAAGAYKTWRPGNQAAFEKRWEMIPWVGGLIGAAGLPNVLTILLLLNFMQHAKLYKSVVICVAFHYNRAETLYHKIEAANLLFCAKFMNFNELSHTTRIGILASTTNPLLWAKVSLLALSFDTMNSTERVSLVVAVCVGWYAALSILAPYVSDTSWRWQWQNVPEKVLFVWSNVVLNVVLVCILAMHTVGIAICESHDFSVVLMTCT